MTDYIDLTDAQKTEALRYQCYLTHLEYFGDIFWVDDYETTSQPTAQYHGRQASTTSNTGYQPYTDPVGLWFSRVMTLVLVVLVIFILAIAGIIG